MDDFKAAVAASADKLVVIDFWATWCGPCRAVAPVIANLAKENADVAFYKVDVDDVPDVAQELGIRSMPTFAFFKGGEKIKEVIGANPPAIKAAVADHK
ncbi:thioredoxin TrxA [Geopyxis carbonaria]|nr:thioredoxin TrxA [Geopyxis carbonaria]